MYYIEEIYCHNQRRSKEVEGILKIGREPQLDSESLTVFIRFVVIDLYPRSTSPKSASSFDWRATSRTTSCCFILRPNSTKKGEKNQRKQSYQLHFLNFRLKLKGRLLWRKIFISKGKVQFSRKNWSFRIWNTKPGKFFWRIAPVAWLTTTNCQRMQIAGDYVTFFKFKRSRSCYSSSEWMNFVVWNGGKDTRLRNSVPSKSRKKPQLCLCFSRNSQEPRRVTVAVKNGSKSVLWWRQKVPSEPASWSSGRRLLHDLLQEWAGRSKA